MSCVPSASAWKTSSSSSPPPKKTLPSKKKEPRSEKRTPHLPKRNQELLRLSHRLFRPRTAGRVPAGHRNLHLHHHPKSDRRRRRHLLRVPAAVAAELVHRLRSRPGFAGGQLHFDRYPFRELQ